MKKHKTLGQVFTPEWIVNEILDLIGYNTEEIINKYILEPSSGDGVFLKEIVKRYINISIRKGIKAEIIIKNLEKYIYGIEIDKTEHNKSIETLNQLIKSKLGNEKIVNWNIINGNTLLVYRQFPILFDYIVGNPPYIRIHNLDKVTREIIKNNFMFSDGTIDIYLSFFEMGIKMLKETGKLGYITPNSYLHNSSYKKLRKYIKDNKLIETLIDFKANKVFKGFSTYTAITILNKNSDNKLFVYKELIGDKLVLINNIEYKNLNNKDWSFSNKNDTIFLNNLNVNKNGMIKDFFDVKYGFATLRDKIFISKIIEYDENLVYFNDNLLEKAILKKIIKGTKYKGEINDVEYILFPYYLKGKRYEPIPEIELENRFPLAYKYLKLNKEELQKRDIDKGALWYEFGRSQGVQTMHNEKIVLSTLMNSKIKYYMLPAEIFVYSGIFIIKNKSYSKWDLIKKTLSSEEFNKYIRLTGKDFSGGYKSITSKQIKEYKIYTNMNNTLF